MFGSFFRITPFSRSQTHRWVVSALNTLVLLKIELTVILQLRDGITVLHVWGISLNLIFATSIFLFIKLTLCWMIQILVNTHSQIVMRRLQYFMSGVVMSLNLTKNRVIQRKVCIQFFSFVWNWTQSSDTELFFRRTHFRHTFNLCP